MAEGELKRLPPRLLALSPGTLRAAAVPDFLRALGACAQTGLRGVLLREPALSDREFLGLAEAVRGLAPGIWLGVHDRVHLAVAAGADAVHLGFRSLPVAAVAEHFGARLTIGHSTHAGDAPAAWEGADYLFHGPLFSVSSKPPGSAAHREPMGPEGLAKNLPQLGKPTWALGGIAPEDVRACLAAGASGIAVLSGILGSRDPLGALRRYLEVI